MDMNRSRIEWCDHTWNPVTGCRHGCPYCYARQHTVRFSGDVKLNIMAKGDYSTMEAADGSGVVYTLDRPMLNETGSPLIYPFGFEPTFYRYRMDMLDKLKMGKNIFVGAMADVFGEWMTDEIIQAIFSACIGHAVHNYLFLTKNPERYGRMVNAGILPQRENFWYGSTLTGPGDRCFISEAYNSFLSIEPILAPFSSKSLSEMSQSGIPGWVVIGAQTGRRKGKVIPQREWIEDIVAWCDSIGIPVFMKDSLIPIVGEENMRREYPPQLKRKPVSSKMEKKLYAACAGCGVRMKKGSMIALLARSRRGDMPKQFGFMCRDCFKGFCNERGIDIPALAGLEGDADVQSGQGDGGDG